MLGQLPVQVLSSVRWWGTRPGTGTGTRPSSSCFPITLIQILNPPITFVIDTTKSVKPDKDSIFNLTKKVVDGIKNDKINIPRFLLINFVHICSIMFLLIRFMLVSFNDFGREINLNVQIEVTLIYCRAQFIPQLQLSWASLIITTVGNHPPTTLYPSQIVHSKPQPKQQQLN